ncbi:MAG: alginate export family protein [Congregibacter sp.]|nr:alginate export family protein [Congregibacter sp.]
MILPARQGRGRVLWRLVTVWISLLWAPLAFSDFATNKQVGWSASGMVRLRTEYLKDSFRLVAPEHDHQQFARSELDLRYRAPGWSFQLEVQDSRAWGAKRLSPVGTDDVNSLEPINLKFSRQWQLRPDTETSLSVGRMTMDYGSRRLLARNNFRNTSNAFQGVHLSHRSVSSQAALFYTLPLQRRPDGFDPQSLRGNEFAWDKAGSGERFWGMHYDYEYKALGTVWAGYIFGSELSDGPDRPVADRDLTTAGSRLTWQGARMDLEAEAAYQWGESLSGALSAPTPLLDHRAWFAHAHAGVDLGPVVNLRLSYDHATGDRDPFDGRNERFDRLYGARAFDLGPSGIFGAAVRSNLRSPGVRVLWKPTDQHTWLLSHRWLVLDSPRDFFVTGARRDISGDSGRDLGRQWELRWRWNPGSAAFTVDVGGAYLDKGDYFKGASTALLNPPSRQDTQYVFTQLTWQY